jgi:hypothetical protein
LNWDIQGCDAFIGHQSYGLAANAWPVAKKISLSVPVVPRLKVERLGEVFAGTL